MTDFDNGAEQNNAWLAEAKERAGEVLVTATEAIDVAELIAGAPLVEPPEKRDQTVLPEGVVMTRVKERAIRAALAEIGLGITEDMSLDLAELPEDTPVLIEAGQRHKQRAELRLAGNAPLVYSASKHRTLGDAERAVTANLFGLEETEVGETEYDSTLQEAQSVEGFIALEKPVVIGHITHDGRDAARVGDSTEAGTLLQIGAGAEGQPVYVFDVPRKYQYDEAGQPIVDGKGNHKYDQPSAAEQALAIGQMIDAAQIAVATSSTYYPSRYVEAVRATYAAVKEGSLSVPEVTVLAYCPGTLAEVKGEPKPAIPGIAHVLGEAYKTRETLTKLQAELTA